MKRGTVLVTGVAGFIGSTLASELLEKDFEVVGIDNLSSGYEANIPPEVKFIEADLAAPNSLVGIKNLKFSAVCHLAAQSSGEISFSDPVHDLNCNVLSTLRLIQFCLANHISSFFYASSMAVYGDQYSVVSEQFFPQPKSYYGVSKFSAEQYLRLNNDKICSTIFRLSNVYGENQDFGNLRQGMVSIYLAQALTNKHIVVKGSTSRVRDFIHVADVVKIWTSLVGEDISTSSLVNVGSGIGTSIDELLSVIQSLVPECSFVEESGTPGDQMVIAPDITKLRGIIGPDYKFVDLVDGIRDLIHAKTH